MKLIKELQNIQKESQGITFELDVVEIDDDIKDIVAQHSGEILDSKGYRVGGPPVDTLVIRVPDVESGNALIDAIYGPEDDDRDSNAFYMGLEEGTANKKIVESEGITFELDDIEVNDEFMDMVAQHSSEILDIEGYGDSPESIVVLRVPDVETGSALIDAIYGPEDDGRESNMVYMGLEEGTANKKIVESEGTPPPVDFDITALDTLQLEKACENSGYTDNDFIDAGFVSIKKGVARFLVKAFNKDEEEYVIGDLYITIGEKGLHGEFGGSSHYNGDEEGADEYLKKNTA